jgi:hypothetical protein
VLRRGCSYLAKGVQSGAPHCREQWEQEQGIQRCFRVGALHAFSCATVPPSPTIPFHALAHFRRQASCRSFTRLSSLFLCLPSLTLPFPPLSVCVSL